MDNKVLKNKIQGSLIGGAIGGAIGDALGYQLFLEKNATSVLNTRSRIFA